MRRLALSAIVWGSLAAGEKISPEDKLILREAQLEQQSAAHELNVLILQSPQYSRLQEANRKLESVVAVIEKKAGCKIDGKTIECKPEEK